MILVAAMNVRDTIGWNLRTLRVAKGLSQERLALEAGIDRSYIGRIERGEENVTVSTLEAAALILEVHVSKLFAEVDPDAPLPKTLPAGTKRKGA